MLSRQEKIQAVREWLMKSKLDPSVTGDTIGIPAGSITPQALVAASAKLIKINQGHVEPDNRDNLKYSKFMGLEDFVKEHIEKDVGGFQRKAQQKIKTKKNLKWLHSGYFSPQVQSTIISNALSQSVEGANPMDHLDLSHRVTKMGPGGIASRDAIPDESRNVESSSFGFLDPFHVPESENIGVTNYFAINTVKGKDNKLYRTVKDEKGNKVWVDHETILNKKLEFPEY